MASLFHEGELAVQRRAGVEEIARRVGMGNLGDALGPELDDFLAEQAFVVVASRDARNRVWASLLVGEPGFARALDERRLLLGATPLADDPLAAALELGQPHVGILVIEPLTRSRFRVNGRAEPTADGIVVTVEEAFGNCPKYIQRRAPAGPIDLAARGTSHRSSNALDAGQRALVAGADTFYIATAHTERGADASHRGGRPGFVEVAGDGTSLRFPDYPGNRMFQTLGNLAVDPRVGLLFVDWERGDTLQITGRGEIVWDEQEIARWPGAQRLVEVEVEAVHEHERAMPAAWALIEASRLNPPVRAGAR